MPNRRLVGPTVIAIVLCGIVADQLFLSASRWSVSRFLNKVVAVFGAIFAPAVNPVHYGWIADRFLPLTLTVLALVLLWLSFAGAKRAMSQTTRGAEVSDPIQVRKVPPQQRPEEAPVPPLKPASKGIRKLSLTGKLVRSFAGIAALFAGAACAIVFSFSSHVIEREVNSRAEVMVLGFYDMLTAAVVAGKTEIRDAAVAKYGADSAVAYLYIEDDKGRIIAHRPEDLPRYLHRDFPHSTERALKGSRDEYRGLETYELAKPIADGKLGFVHLAVSRQVVAAEVHGVIAAIVAMILLALLCVIGGFVFAARALNRPFVELVGQAERISKGDFTVPLALQRTDEVGDIARSLERLRSSLRAVAARVEQVQMNRRSNE